MSVIRHFASHAGDYARFRPDYPPALFEWLKGQAGGHDRAWDCGCGNGQASVPLAAHFRHVIATDPALAQIRQARRHPRVAYAAATAERSPVPDDSCDLVTVAQALHWLDLDRFYAEVARVLKRDGALAAWTYQLLRIEGRDEVQTAFDDFYRREIAPWWPPQRRWVDEGYRSLPFPFAEVSAPAFEIRREWALDGFLSYVTTWSSVQKRLEMQGDDLTARLGDVLRPLWGEATLEIVWPIAMRAGRRAGT